MKIKALHIYRQKWRIFSRLAIQDELIRRRERRMYARFYMSASTLLEGLRQERQQAWQEGDMLRFFELQDAITEAIRTRDKFIGLP